MPDLLTSLEERWAVFAYSPAGQRALERWQASEPVLGEILDLAALTQAARDRAGTDLDHRDEVHLALLRLAAADQDARCAVLHLLHPALSATARLYADTWDRDELASMIVTAALDRIVTYPCGRPRPAAVIVRWVRRALWKEAERQRVRHRAVGRPEVLDEETLPSAGAGVSAVEELLALVHQAVRAGVLDPPKARLILLHRVAGVPTAAIAAVEGIPPATIRQRRVRAEAALAQHAGLDVA